jgi:acetyl esterase/lipase
VEYRLSPENTKQEGLDDCIKVTEHLIRNAAKYGVDPERVVVAGDSAGGNYAAGVALYLRDQKFSPLPKLQLLIYPSFQAIDMELPSYQQHGNGPVLTKHLLCLIRSCIYSQGKTYLDYFANHTHVPGYVRVAMAQGVLNHDIIPDVNKYPPYVKPNFEHGGSDIWENIKEALFDPYNCPLMAKDHSGLPEAYIFTSQYDPLRDEGYLYAHKLRQDGVAVTHYNCPVCWHGLISSVTKQQDATEVMNRMVDFIKHKL